MKTKWNMGLEKITEMSVKHNVAAANISQTSEVIADVVPT